MRSRRTPLQILGIALAAVLALTTALTAQFTAAAGPETREVSLSTALTSGTAYDRNPSLLHAADGTYYLFFARSTVAPCVRPSCNPDNNTYNIFYMTSADGLTWGAPTQLSDRTGIGGTFYGRTVAATQDAAGTIWVFWASGGNSADLYYYTNAGSGWSARAQLSDAAYFNAEAVATPDGKVWLFYEDGSTTGIYARYWNGTTWSAPTLVAAGMSLPKAIVDGSTFRLVMVDGATGTDYITSSADGITWTAPVVVAAPGGGVTNWDPTIFKDGAGKYNIFLAPDLGTGPQRIAWTQSADGTTWPGSNTTVTAARYGANDWWDYWPEAGQIGSATYLFYTSEKAGTTRGSGHILMTRIYWDPASNHYEAIQPAIDAAVPGDTANLAAGTYAESIVINKDSLTLQGNTAATTTLQGAGTGTGIAFSGARSNISIKRLTATNWQYGLSLPTGPLNTVLIEDVAAVNNTLHGIWVQASPINGVTLRRVNASGNSGGTGRGVWLINGAKSNITIEDGTYNNNGLVGIDISDGSVTGLAITGNTVTGNGDSGIGVLGAQGTGANLVANNTVTNNGRFGIEIKNSAGNGALSGPGSVVVENNTVSRTVAATRVEDYAGILVIRRSPQAGVNPDQPSGIVIRNNQVSGYHRKPTGSTGDGFGIVVEGLNEQVLDNTVTGNDVGIQVQGGNPSINQQGTAYFDRGNAAAGNGTVTGNRITGNDIGGRNVGGPAASTFNGENNWWGSANGPTAPGNTYNVGAQGDSAVNDIDYVPWLDAAPPAGQPFAPVTTTDPPGSYSSIQAGVTGSNIRGTLNAEAGTFTENVIISRTLTVAGAGRGTIVIPAVSNPNCNSGGGGSLCGGAASNVFLVRANGVTIHDLIVNGDNPTLTSGIVRGGADLDARNGIITDNVAGNFATLTVYRVTVYSTYLRGIQGSGGSG
ncbi:MAG TPA: hypothetical protein VF276_07630, partial [Chloroflexia bacterium]